MFVYNFCVIFIPTWDLTSLSLSFQDIWTNSIKNDLNCSKSFLVYIVYKFSTFTYFLFSFDRWYLKCFFSIKLFPKYLIFLNSLSHTRRNIETWKLLFFPLSFLVVKCKQSSRHNIRLFETNHVARIKLCHSRPFCPVHVFRTLSNIYDKTFYENS